MEAVKEFRCHYRLVAAFFYSLNALHECDLLSKGQGRLMKKLVSLENKLKLTIETEEDLVSMIKCYDTLLSYIRMRTRWAHLKNNLFDAYIGVIPNVVNKPLIQLSFIVTDSTQGASRHSSSLTYVLPSLIFSQQCERK